MFDRIHTQKCESCTNDKKLCCFICGVYENGDREYYNPKLMTNGDRFRSMSDEELAKFLCDIVSISDGCYGCVAEKYCEEPFDGHDNGFEQWLKQECER